MTKTNSKNLNDFFFDATSFIAKADELIKPKMWDNDAILALLLSSIGLEKILKGILHEVNPIYVFPKPTFEESSQALYGQLFVDKKDLNNLTRVDTISFTTAIQRSKIFSKTVASHFSLLYKLANTRNLIAHNICMQIDRDFVRPFLLKEFRPLIREFNEELKFKKDTFFQALPWVLSTYSDEKEEPEIPLENMMAEKLERHRLTWEQRKKDVSFVDNKMDLTRKLEDDRKNILISCPACGNYSLLYFEPDYDYSDGQSWLVGLFVTHLDCLFCDLNIIEYDELDYFDLNHRLQDYWSKK